MKHFVLIALIVAIIGVAIYAVVTQLSGNIKLNGVISPSLFDYSIAPATSSPAAGTGSGSASSPSAPPAPTQPTIVPPAGFTLAELSPYYQKVRLTNVVPPTAYNPGGSQFSIQATGFNSATGTVDVTGWRVKGNGNGQVIVPQATGDYLSFSSPVDIVLRQGDYATLYSTQSPIAASIRLNECTGYLNNENTFAPPLPNDCPPIPQSKIATYAGNCQSFLFSLGSCAEPTPAQKNQFAGPNDTACRTLMDNLNYRTCYQEHRADASFFSNEWRIWTGSPMPFDPQHDRVLLFDRQGLLVDMYTY